jgi:hypothetical protein
MNPLLQVKRLGQNPWLDNLSSHTLLPAYTGAVFAATTRLFRKQVAS